MWGISPLDMLTSILKFEDFKEQSIWGKVKWILGYPIALLLLIGIIVMFFVVTITSLFKNKS